MSDLDLSNIINVTILGTQTGLGLPNINTAALFSRDTPSAGWDEGQEYKLYTNPTTVGTDFGTGSDAYKLAVAFFAQNPNVLQTNGYLAIVLLDVTSISASRTIQGLVYTAVTPGTAGNSITIIYVDDGTKGAETVGVAGSDITVHMEDGASIAAEIAAAIQASGSASALVSIAFVPDEETSVQADFSPALALENGSATVAESIEEAIARVASQIFFFGVFGDEILSDDDLLALATFMQTQDKVLFYGSGDVTDLAASAIFDDIRSASLTHARCLYYNEADDAFASQEFAAAYCGRALSTAFDGSNTTQTMHLKQLAGFVPDPSIDQTTLQLAQNAGVDIYCSFAGLVGLFTSGRNTFFDEVYNELWFKFALQTAGANYLAQTSTKIPQTEPGLEGLKNVFRRICDQAVRNGFVGPGEWNSSTVFGDPESLRRNVRDIGYYVYSLPISQQSQEAREARQAPLVQIAVKAQGAIQKAFVIVNVNL